MGEKWKAACERGEDQGGSVFVCCSYVSFSPRVSAIPPPLISITAQCGSHGAPSALLLVETLFSPTNEKPHYCSHKTPVTFKTQVKVRISCCPQSYVTRRHNHWEQK